MRSGDAVGRVSGMKQRCQFLMRAAQAAVLVGAALSSALAQDPKIYLDVDDITAKPGDAVPVSVLIENITDTIRAFQLWLVLDRPDLITFDSDTIFQICYTCSDSACTSVVAYPCTVQVGSLEVGGTLIEDWEFWHASVFGSSSVRVTAIGNTDFGWPPKVIPPQTNGVLFRVMARVLCNIPNTSENRTVGITMDSSNAFFSNASGDLIIPLDLTDGSVTAEREFIRCPYQGDLEPDGFITVLDLTAIVDALFEEGPNPQDPCCPSFRFDLECDGFTTALDLAAMVDHLFAGGPGPCDPATP
jgi:hypothetical protein